MARSKSFDPAEKLEVAMHLFWGRGYEATSLENLEETLTLKRFSIYNAYGDKLKLYKSCLELYLARFYYPAIKVLHNPGGLAGIEQFFNDQIDFMARYPQGKGCFVFKASLEMEREHPEVSELTRKAQDDLRQAFAQALKLAEQKGALSHLVEPEASSRWLLTIYRGLVSSETVERDQAWMADFTHQLKHLLGSWQAEANQAYG